ncbi:class I SAM-dependent methyltransferase [Miltoncostaea marina]|uniref:class I SAM-dependent methyltransferase n=1 Tax=Miltoncostaea marina TaxID=2843215 RepID=UPI001C3C1D41|nr:class I SAM-dependent methyltransferase [Miltoncostaea marina]
MLNWITRYAPVADLLLDGDGRLADSLLDVGSGSVGFACVGGDQPFVGIDVDFWGPPAPAMVPLRSVPGRLPFADRAFDTVISLDALEHVPPGEREGFVAEIARVAARRAVVVCPCDEAAGIDELMRRMYARRGEEAPGWLWEHAEHGLPTRAAVAAACAAPEGFAARELAMPNGLLSLLATVADTDPELQPLARAEVARRPGLWADLFRDSADPSSFRVGWVLERHDPAPAAVRRDDLLATTLAALRCPRCGGCAPWPERDGIGAIDLTHAWSCA